MSLAVGVLILAMAVMLGGVAGVFRQRGSSAIPAIRGFAVVAAASTALLHLLPEAIVEVGWHALIAGAAGFVAPALIERIAGAGGRDGARRAPTTALAVGYAAVLVHQLGEGAAVASLARVGQLSPGVILAIAAHTVPLAMVVAIRVLETAGDVGGKRATMLALLGIALATVVGVGAAELVGDARLSSMKPWLLSVVAGILLHALSHESGAAPPTTVVGRASMAAASLLGLAVAVIGVDDDELWLRALPIQVRIAGGALLAGLVVLYCVAPRRATSHRH